MLNRYVTCLYGAIIVFVLILVSIIYLSIYRKNIKAIITHDNGEMIIDKVEQFKTPTYSDDGPLFSVFTADTGVAGLNGTMVFTNPVYREFHPGTNKISKLISADKAIIKMNGLSSFNQNDMQWQGNLKMRSFNNE